MAKQSGTAAFLLVLTQTQKKQETLALKVQKADAFVQQENAQAKSLDEYLQAYLQEYQHKIREQRLCTASDLSRYRGFCGQLQNALIQQQEKVVLAESHLAKLRQSLMQLQHKISVLQNLIKEREQQLSAADEKKLQKTIDELSARSYFS
jgi:flagellar export protein FliJ